MAVTDPERGARGGITAFLVDKGTPGLVIARAIPMLAGARTYEVVFEDCRVHESQVLGRVGAGFASPMQLRLTVRRLQMGLVVRRNGPARARHDGRACQPARDLRAEAGRPAGDPVVDCRCRDQVACLPPDGDGCGGQAGRGPRRAHGGFDDQGLRDRDGDGGDRPMPSESFGAMGVTQELPLAIARRRRSAPCGFTKARPRCTVW